MYSLAEFTTTIETICREYSGETNYKKSIPASIPHIFDFDFPIFDPEYHDVLCTKILKHYYQREICFDNLTQWKMHLDARLNEIMPRMNKLYHAAQIEFDPLTGYKETREYSRTGDNTENAKTKSTTTGSTSGTTSETVDGEALSKNSQTPQGGLQGLREDRYLTAAAMTENNQTTKGNNTQTDSQTGSGESDRKATTTEEYVETVSRQTENGAAAIMKYRQSLFDVDMLIIAQLADLFMSIMYY